MELHSDSVLQEPHLCISKVTRAAGVLLQQALKYGLIRKLVFNIQNGLKSLLTFNKHNGQLSGVP